MLEAAEIRQPSGGIGCKKLVNRDTQLNPEGANRERNTHTYQPVRRPRAEIVVFVQKCCYTTELTKYYTTTGAAAQDFRMCDCFAGTKKLTTSDLVVHSKLASGGTSATAGKSARAVSNLASTSDTDVKVEVKREPVIDVFEGYYHGNEDYDVCDEYKINGVLD